MLKKIKQLRLSATIISVVFVLVAAGSVYAATQIYNNYYGSVVINQGDSENESFGSVTAIGGLCDGSEPTTQLCNVNVYELESQTDLTVGGKIASGGDVTDATSTMEIAFTLTAAQVCDSAVISVNSGCSADTAACNVAASLDITFPATSTLFALCLDDDGDYTEFIFYNSSPTAASTTQMVAGTGGYLFEPDGQDVLIGGGNAVKVKLQRVDGFESNEDYMLFIDEHIAG